MVLSEEVVPMKRPSVHQKLFWFYSIPDEENSEMDGWAVCPSCGEYITHPDGHEVTYCRYCGQAIKWEDEEDDE